MADESDTGESSVFDADARLDLPRAEQGIFGLLDVVSTDMIEGWAFDPANPDTPLEVVITVDGQDVWTGRAEMFREDLAQVKVGSGRHAFRCFVEPAWLGREPEEHLVRAFVPGFDAELRGSPRTLRAPAAPPEAIVPRVAPAADPAPEPDILKRVQPEPEPAPPAMFERPRTFIGCLDQVDETSIRGWAFEVQAPQVPVSIDLFDEDTLIARVEANLFRDDLRRSGFGDGRHSFMLPTPTWLLDGRRHIVRAVVSNTTKQLQKSPVAVDLAAADPLRALSDVEAMLAALTRSVDILRTRLQPLALQSQQHAGVDPYALWQARYGVLTSEDRAQIAQAISSMWRRPLLSVVMPTYNTKPEFLKAAIGSVQAQLYPEWELCIADDGSEPETVALVGQLAQDDPRIRLVLRPKNGGIAAATNSAMALARGDYVCFLDHDDALTEDALFQFAQAIQRDEPDLVYSDEDKIDECGRLHSPHFKPDFNHRLLLGYNYLCHLVAVRRALAEQVGPLRSEMDGAQDHDFILRCLERGHATKVSHVPLVLYHWRTHPGSTAVSLQAKSYARHAGLDAISAHLRRTGQDAAVQPSVGGSYRVTWHLSPDARPLVSVVIPTRDQGRNLSVCLSGLTRMTEYAPIEIIIVNNGSVQPDALDVLHEAQRDPRVRVLDCDQPFNFSALVNLGAANAAGELVLFLNDDIEVVEGGWLSEMVREISRPGVGAVGAKLLYPDGRIQHAGVILGIGGVAGHSHKYFEGGAPGYMNRLNMAQEVSACTAACLLVRRGAFETVGGFDAENLPVAFNDVDLCLRLREAGFTVVFTPHAVLRHHESISRGAEDSPAKTLRSGREIDFMLRRWDRVLAADPFYSRNLTLQHEDFSIDPARGAPRTPPIVLVADR